MTPFISKVNGVYYKKDSILDVTEERARELEGYVTIVEPSSTKVDEDKPKATKKKTVTKKK